MQLSESYQTILKEVENLIVGQSEVIKMSLLTLLAGGHVLLEGVPGLAKTLMVKALARVLGLKFQRIQFTPDLLPSDITGTDIFEGEFRFIEGPVFTQILLADEINRTPPKTQSALLQAMQEQQVTVLGKTYELPKPFFVMATQNPIEQEGTYPLPEAQLDRFMTHLILSYPDVEEEQRILDIHPEDVNELKTVLNQAQLIEMQDQVRRIPAGDSLKRYVVELVRETRPDQTRIAEVRDLVEWGAGPRASQLLLRLSQARAAVLSKPIVDKEDVDACLVQSLRHRLVLNYRGLSEKTDRGDLIKRIQKEVVKFI